MRKIKSELTEVAALTAQSQTNRVMLNVSITQEFKTSYDEKSQCYNQTKFTYITPPSVIKANFAN